MVEQQILAHPFRPYIGFQSVPSVVKNSGSVLGLAARSPTERRRVYFVVSL